MQRILCLIFIGVLSSVQVFAQSQVIEIPKRCSVEELEYLLAKNSMMDIEYCFDFSQGNTIGFNLGDGAYVSGGYDYLSNSVRSILVEHHNELKKSLCERAPEKSDAYKQNQNEEAPNVDKYSADVKAILESANENSAIKQVYKIPGVLNELIWAIKNDKKEFEANIENGVITGVPRVGKALGVVIKVDGYADGQYNGIRFYDSLIVNELCEKDGAGNCKVENGKYIINISEAALKQNLKGIQVGVSAAEKNDSSAEANSLKQEYIKPVNCSQNPNHVTCKIFERLKKEGVNLNSLKYNSIPSVCSDTTISRSSRQKTELLPSMLRNYYLARDRAENLTNFLTNSYGIDGLSEGPDAYKVLSWQLTSQIEDIKGKGYGVCDLRRGAKVSVDLKLSDKQPELLDPYAELTIPFASPSGTTQNILQLSATLDVFKRINRLGGDEKEFLEALFNAAVYHPYAILKFDFEKLKEELSKKNAEWGELKPSDVKRKLDLIAFNVVPYACQGADYSVDTKFGDDHPVNDYDLYINMTKKIILDMIAGFKKDGKSYSDFIKLYNKSLTEIIDENILSENLKNSAMVAFTNKYGRKIKKSDVERSTYSSPKTFGANAKLIGALDFYKSIPGSPALYITELREQSKELMAAQYDENLRRNLTPTIAMPVFQTIPFSDNGQASKVNMDASNLKQLKVFRSLGNSNVEYAGRVKDVGKFKDWYFLHRRNGDANVVACNGTTKYLIAYATSENRIVQISKNRVLSRLLNDQVKGGIENTRINKEGKNFVISDEVQEWIDESTCSNDNSEFIFAKHTPLYSPYLIHAGGVTPSSVLNCFSTREGYVHLHKIFKNAELNVASNNASIEDNKLLNDKHFSFTDYKSVAAPNVDKTSWFLKVKYSGDVLKDVKYRGYTHEHTYGATRKGEKTKNGFVCGGWGSGVAFERQPSSHLPPSFDYHERKLSEPNYSENLKYAVQFKKAYQYFKGSQSNPMFEYISRFRERDEYDKIDEKYGESASQVFYTDALTKYYQLRSYMKDYYIDKSSSKDVKDYLLFGESKNPHLYVLNNCNNCECIANIETFDTALREAKIYNFYDGFDSNNEKAYQVDSDNGNICLFTPFVPHTCSFRPGGKASIAGNTEDQVIYQHVACNLTRYLQGRLEALKTARSPLLKSDPDAKAIVEYCRNKKFYFPVSNEKFNQYNVNVDTAQSEPFGICNVPLNGGGQ